MPDDMYGKLGVVLRVYIAQTVRVLVLAVLTSTLSFAQTRRPNFSGRWQVDRSRSEVTYPDKLRGMSIIQLIEHKEPIVTITRITRGSSGEERLDIHLITDGSKRINKVEDHELSFRTRWEGSRLVITIRPITSGTPAVIMEVWSLSKDGDWLTVELHLQGEKDRGREKVVYRRILDGQN